MRAVPVLVLSVMITLLSFCLAQTPLQKMLTAATVSPNNAGCISLTTRVDNFDPFTTVDTLFNNLITQTPYRCIQTYGLTESDIIKAQNRNIKVIGIIYLEPNPSSNTAMINHAISMANTYSNTIIGLTCGSELRARNGRVVAENAIIPCINALKNAGVVQPVGVNEAYWGWCNEAYPCAPWSAIFPLVDFIGANIYPWWDNKFSTCVSAAEAADKNVYFYNVLQGMYTTKPVVVTEWGWPAGPDGYRRTNDNTQQLCTGVASEFNQNKVIQETHAKFKQFLIPSILFDSFREPVKINEGPEGPYWGICSNSYPYTCKSLV